MLAAQVVIGWAQPMLSEPLEHEHECVAVIVASDFKENRALIGETIAVGLDRDPYIVWVVRERDAPARETLDELGIEPVLATLNPYYKFTLGDTIRDHRSGVRDCEILRLCTRVIVFRTPDTKTLEEYADPLWSSKVRVIERGKKKAVRRKKGKSLE